MKRILIVALFLSSSLSYAQFDRRPSSLEMSHNEQCLNYKESNSVKESRNISQKKNQNYRKHYDGVQSKSQFMQSEREIIH